MSNAIQRAQAAERYAQEHSQGAHTSHAAACIAHGAEVLATAVRSWATLPPETPAAIDAAATQVEGIRRAIGELRTTMHK